MIGLPPNMDIFSHFPLYQFNFLISEPIFRNDSREPALSWQMHQPLPYFFLNFLLLRSLQPQDSQVFFSLKVGSPLSGLQTHFPALTKTCMDILSLICPFCHVHLLWDFLLSCPAGYFLWKSHGLWLFYLCHSTHN